MVQRQAQPLSRTRLRAVATTWPRSAAAVGMLLADTTNDDALLLEQQAFTDQVDLFDTPVQILLVVFGVVVLLLTAVSVVSRKVDTAILQTLHEFETALRTYFPARWKQIQGKLQGLPPGDARNAALLQLMEELQDAEPAFMAQVREKMDS